MNLSLRLLLTGMTGRSSMEFIKIIVFLKMIPLDTVSSITMFIVVGSDSGSSSRYFSSLFSNSECISYNYQKTFQRKGLTASP